MQNPKLVPINLEREPTSEQLQRASELRRFNRLYVYLPVVLVSLVVLILFALLLVAVLVSRELETLIRLSAVADAVVILFTIPAIIVCGALPTLALVLAIRGRSRGIAPLRSTQRFLWLVDTTVGNASKLVDQIALKISRPFIASRAWAAYLRSLFNRIIGLLKRS